MVAPGGLTERQALDMALAGVLAVLRQNARALQQAVIDMFVVIGASPPSAPTIVKPPVPTRPAGHGEDRLARADRLDRLSNQLCDLLAQRWFGLAKSTAPVRTVAWRLLAATRGKGPRQLVAEYSFDDALSVVELAPKPTRAQAIAAFRQRKGQRTKTCARALALLGYAEDDHAGGP